MNTVTSRRTIAGISRQQDHAEEAEREEKEGPQRPEGRLDCSHTLMMCVDWICTLEELSKDRLPGISDEKDTIIRIPLSTCPTAD